MRVSIQSDVGGAKSPKLLTSPSDSPRVIVKSGGAGGLDWIQLSSSPLPFLCESIQHQLRVTRTSNKLKLKLKRKKEKKESCLFFFSLFFLIFISSCCFFVCFSFERVCHRSWTDQTSDCFARLLSLHPTSFFCFLFFVFLFYFLLRE